MTDEPIANSHLSLSETARRVLGLIDLTSLGDDDTDADIDELCTAAITPFGSVAAVCVWPRFVARAVEKLSEHDIPVAGVANFPEGDNDPARAVEDATQIIDAGGREIDVVYPWRALQANGGAPGGAVVRAVRDAIPSSATLKVILETGELADDELIRIAALDSIDSGADFLKTSTGKTEHSATPSAVRLLCEIVAAQDASIGVKVSGGVRTVADAEQYLHIADATWGPDQVRADRFRVGASSLLDDVLATIE